jgi:OOP family OmpA-OmpF porin
MGKSVDPDRLWDRDFTKKNRATLFKERDRLVMALDNGGRAQQPGYAARAQAQFDCWAQELEENNQPRDIQRCRIAYMEAMREMADAMKPAPKPAMKMAAKPKKKKKKAKRKAASFKMPFVVYFDFDSTNLSDMDSVRTLTSAAKAAKKGKSTRIQVMGHTDTSGDAGYNAKLAERRATVVDEALIALGINGLTIERSSSGERELEVETGDGVRKDANRRVVIVVH